MDTSSRWTTGKYESHPYSGYHGTRVTTAAVSCCSRGGGGLDDDDTDADEAEDAAPV